LIYALGVERNLGNQKEAIMKFVKLASTETKTRYINLSAIKSVLVLDEDSLTIEIEWTSGTKTDDKYEEFEGWQAERILEAVEAVTH
jgi:hypothetical protein